MPLSVDGFLREELEKDRTTGYKLYEECISRPLRAYQERTNRVEDSNDNDCRQNEGGSGLSIFGNQTTIRGSRCQRSSGVRVDDSSACAEQGQFDGHGDVQRFGKILRTPHVADERRNQCLADKGIAGSFVSARDLKLTCPLHVRNVQDRIHALHKRRSLRRPNCPVQAGGGCRRSGGHVAIGGALNTMTFLHECQYWLLLVSLDAYR